MIIAVFKMTLALTKKDFNEDSKILNDEGLEQPRLCYSYLSSSAKSTKI